MELNEVNQSPTPAEPRPASTLVVMRDGAQGLEVLLTVRSRQMRFMGGGSVFPGGGVSPADLDPRWEGASTLTTAEAAAALGLDDPAEALGSYVCALREAFEEVGFLLGSGPIDQLLPDDADDPAHFLELCLERGITLDTNALVPAGRWVTPLGAPIRFDTRFFLGVATDPYVPRPDPGEVESVDWVSAAEALAALASGDRLMAPPTVEMLQRLDRYSTTEEAIEGFGTEGLRGAGKVLSLRVSPLVHVVLAPNAGVMTGPGTNTYIVGSGPYLLIDPAMDDGDYLDAIFEVTGGDIDQILVTHRHSDHVGGAAVLAEQTDAPVRAFGSDVAGEAQVIPVADGEGFQIPGVDLVSMHTPGHASDHLCFYMQGAASLFAGDNILGEGTAVIAPPDGDMAAYLRSLHRLRELHIDRIYPGHWKPLDGGRAVIDAYIAHRGEREAKVLAAVGANPTSVDEIVKDAYQDTPEHLHPVARFSALAHLEKLRSEGRVREVDSGWMTFRGDEEV